MRNLSALLPSKRVLFALLFLSICAFSVSQGIQIPKLSIDAGPAKDPKEVSTSLQILGLLTVLSLAPALMILTTAFTRIVIIFGFLRNAIGTPTLPPNQVIIGLSLFITFFVMAPTYEKINKDAIQPYMAGMPFDKAVQKAEAPLKDFMLKNTYEKDLILFLDFRGEKPKSQKDVSMVSLIPAFVISELKTAFIIGFYIFVPFIIVDLIVASGLMSMGMMMLPPSVVSLPAKILIFLLADGWHTIVDAILRGYS